MRHHRGALVALLALALIPAAAGAQSGRAQNLGLRAAYTKAGFRCPVAARQVDQIVGRSLKASGWVGQSCNFTDVPSGVGVVLQVFSGDHLASLKQQTTGMLGGFGCRTAAFPKLGRGAFATTCAATPSVGTGFYVFFMPDRKRTWSVDASFAKAPYPSLGQVMAMVMRLLTG
jgi:hypothetical protein